MFDSLLNITAYLGNTTENFFKVSNLKIGHNYSFTVQASCLYSGQMCGEPATLLYDELGAGKSLASSPSPFTKTNENLTNSLEKCAVGH